jgi:hydrogenase maturation protease
LAHSESARESAAGNPVKESARKLKIAVLGIGNLLMKDEGIGVHLVQKLEEMGSHSNVTFIDGGTNPDTLFLLYNDIDKLLIIDAAKAGGTPGTLYRFTADEIELGSAPISLHELGLANGLQMMELLNNKPESITIIGIEPEKIDFGLELSPQIKRNIPLYLETVIREINEMNMCMEVSR